MCQKYWSGSSLLNGRASAQVLNAEELNVSESRPLCPIERSEACHHFADGQ